MTTPATPVPTAAVRSAHRRRWPFLLFVIVVVLPVAGVTLWTLAALHFTYSSGERAGYVQKFSHKGWLCKTWEGELAIVNVPGSQPQIFDFTVRDDSVARIISAQSMGNRVVLHYRQHRGVPFSCLGETEYFVDSAHVPAAS